MRSPRIALMVGFYPRSPCGERLFLRSDPMTRRCFYPRSPCGERHTVVGQSETGDPVSIHALLAESDTQGPLHGGSVGMFLSTLSLRRATAALSGGTLSDVGFYPRSPCGERLGLDVTIIGRTWGFYPRSPCGERRLYTAIVAPPIRVSIHALLAESDIPK